MEFFSRVKRRVGEQGSVRCVLASKKSHRGRQRKGEIGGYFFPAVRIRVRAWTGFHRKDVGARLANFVDKATGVDRRERARVGFRKMRGDVRAVNLPQKDEIGPNAPLERRI